MIEINLLPQELRKRQTFQLILPQKYLKNALWLIIGAIVLIHIFIQGIIVIQQLVHNVYQRRLSNIQPQEVQAVDEMKNEVQQFKAMEDLISQLSKQRLRVAPLLNFISDNLPQGIWLTELSLSKEEWELKGACVSATGSEMAQVGKFLNALTRDVRVNTLFPKLELAQVARKKLGATEVVEFTISSKKQKTAGPKKK